MTLGEWLDKWLTEYMQGTVRDSTMESYISYTEKYIKPALSEKRVAFLTTAQIQKFYNYLRKNGRIRNRELFGEGLSDGMVGRIHCMLHEALCAAVREHLISKNPTDGTNVPKQPKIRRPGTGCIFRINENKWEGSYSPKLPNGKRQ